MLFKFTRNEKFITFLIALAVILLNVAPYAYQRYFHQAPSNKVYIGSYPIVNDKPTYMAEMLQGQEGNWKLIDKYTTEPQNGAYIYTFYMLLGHIARITGLSLEAIFFLSRFFFGIILLITVIYFIQRFVVDKNQRIFAYFFAFFASGLGWYRLKIEWPNMPPDVWIPDAIPLVRFSYFPHMTLGNAMLLLSIFLVYRSITKKDRRSMIIAGLLLFFLNFILTFNSVFLYLFIFLFIIAGGLWKVLEFKESVKNALILLAVSLPSFLYMLYLGIMDPIWSGVEKQNVLISPDYDKLIIAYGLILLFSLLGIKGLYKDNKLKSLFFLVWIFVVLAFSYVPIWIYPMQHRFLETAFYVPLAIMASYGIKEIYNYLRSQKIARPELKFNMAFASIIAPLLLIGNFQNWVHFNSLISDHESPIFYLPAENIEAMKWLRQNSSPQSIVLSNFDDGNLIPYYADRFVYIGHAPETLNYYEKMEKMENFYSGKYSSREIYDFLKKERIDYVFYSSEEKKLGAFDPNKYDFLKKIYQNKDANIYKTEF